MKDTCRSYFASAQEEKEGNKEMRNRKMVVILILITVAVLAAGCSKNSTQQETGKVKITATIFAAYDFAAQIGQENASVELLLPPGGEAHTYEPTPRDIINIGNSDIFICAGGEGDAWVDRILDSIDNKDLKIIRMMDCTEVLEEELVEGMEPEDEEEGEGEDEDEPEWDEHVWMSPLNVKKICAAIAAACKECDADHAAEYDKNLEAYSNRLDELDAKIRELVAGATRKTVIFADRFPARYFVEEYGLKYYAAFPGCSDNTEASAATVSFLINKVKEENIPVIFKIELSAGKLAGIVADETGAEVSTFYIGHNIAADEKATGVTFIQMMERNLEALKKALY